MCRFAAEGGVDDKGLRYFFLTPAARGWRGKYLFNEDVVQRMPALKGFWKCCNMRVCHLHQACCRWLAFCADVHRFARKTTRFDGHLRSYQELHPRQHSACEHSPTTPQSILPTQKTQHTPPFERPHFRASSSCLALIPCRLHTLLLLLLTCFALLTWFGILCSLNTHNPFAQHYLHHTAHLCVRRMGVDI